MLSDRCYLRPQSTDQSGVADEQKSVARQIDHARRYAAGKGWTVDDAHVYVDDGISGAEFANRPVLQRSECATMPDLHTVKAAGGVQ